MSRFIHLHTHSHYSLLQALPTTKELVGRAKEYGMDALALTDAGSLYGAVDFYQAAKKEGVKPIIGLDAYLAPRTRHDKETGIDKPRARLVLLAENNTGYKNLIKIVTASYIDGFYYRPRIDRELIEKHKEGLIAILPSFSGEPANAFKDENVERAGAVLDWYKTVFGERLYVEITHHPEIPGHEKVQTQLIDLAKQHNVPLVAAHDVYYLDKEDRRARETMIKIGTGGTVDDASDDRDEDFSFISEERALELFKDTPEAIDNTRTIADRCNVEIELGTWYFPDYKIESGRNPDDELEVRTLEGVTWRGLSMNNDEVKKRIEYELGVIKMKGYSKYFLVVSDLINEARRRKILTTIRGSVAGSLTTYVLGITNVNPLEYKLPFERFLNPERPSAPDVDMDYADNRRDEIIDYARQKYGADHVAQIGTFGTMMARAAVRDVARALGHPYTLGDRIAKLIPMGSQGFAMTIDRALSMEDELRSMYKKERDVREVIDLAKKIEGKVRHISVHAAGVVIAPEPLTEFVPLQPDPKGGGKLITQYEMHSVGEDGVGLLKFDFLGIKNLSILADAVKRVEKIRGVKVDIENIPLDDQKTFEMPARGETIGLFQLNGAGMTRFLKELKPTSIHDINAMVALYRPGPMESIPQYIERKHNSRLVSYLDPRLKDILDRSYGVVTYQDDVLMIAITLAGYSWLEADKLRKAMGKKIPEVMEAEKEKLLKGFIEYGKLPGTKAEQLWKLIEPFAAYGFNKAHAASYGKVAYQTAYMKANFPEEYMSAVLTADSGDVESIAQTIAECERMGIRILPPDVNESFAGFSVVPGESTIRFGLTTIKNFGEGIAEAIIDERKAREPYASLSDFLRRVQNKNLNKKSLESLIKAGAMDRFMSKKGGRGELLQNLDTLLSYNREQGEAIARAQDSLFGAVQDAHDLELAPSPDVSPTERLSWEKELLGIYVSGHPLESYKEALGKRPTIASVKADNRQGIPVVVAGIIDEIKEIMTKKGDHMAFMRVSDLTDSIEVVIFPDLLREKKDVCTSQNVVALKGRYSIRNGTPSIVAEAVKSL